MRREWAVQQHRVGRQEDTPPSTTGGLLWLHRGRQRIRRDPPRVEGQLALFSPHIQVLTSSRRSLTDTPRIVLSQTSGGPVPPEGDTKSTITPGKDTCVCQHVAETLTSTSRHWILITQEASSDPPGPAAAPVLGSSLITRCCDAPAQPVPWGPGRTRLCKQASAFRLQTLLLNY